MKSPEGMSAIVTGGGSGIGAATAAHFAARGARVTICGRRPEAVASAADAAGPNCRAVVADVTVDADRRRLVDAAVEFGGGLDTLISNAGNMYRGPVTELDEAQLLAVFHTNVVAGMLLTGLCVPHMVERGGGAVCFLGSIHTQRAFPGASPYAATKGALEALTDAGSGEHLVGLVAVAVRATFDHGVAPDPDDPPTMDTTTKRPYWGRYPVLFKRS